MRHGHLQPRYEPFRRIFEYKSSWKKAGQFLLAVFYDQEWHIEKNTGGMVCLINGLLWAEGKPPNQRCDIDFSKGKELFGKALDAEIE